MATSNTNKSRSRDPKGKSQKRHEGVAAPTAIYFDSNAFIGAGWPTASAQLLQVINLATQLHVELRLPEPVLHELQAHWIRGVTAEWSAANKHIQELNAEARGIARYDKLGPMPSFEKLRESLAGLTHKIIENFKLIPITSRALPDIFQLAIRRQATFKDEGRGFQDAVILASIVDHLTSLDADDAVLITNDAVFKTSPVNEFVQLAQVKLRVVVSLDELAQLLRNSLKTRVRELMDKQEKELVCQLEEIRPEIQRYLIDHLSFAVTDLPSTALIKKIASLEVIKIESAHTTVDHEDCQSQKPENVRIWADVKIRLTLETSPLPKEDDKLKVGAPVYHGGLTLASIVESVVYQALAQQHDTIAVIELDAVKAGSNYNDFHFTSAYLKTNQSGWSALLSQK